MNLEQIRVFVRTQLDLDVTDLPDALLNVYIQDGYEHILNLENRWPFFETMWQVTVPAATSGVAFPVDTASVESVLSIDGHRLWKVDSRYAEDYFGGQGHAGTPAYWTQLGPTLGVYPSPGSDYILNVRGYRRPSNWIAAGASAEVDADARLHLPIVWYACSLGYAQQEDEVLEATYLNRFREAAAVAKDSVMRSWSGAPKILNSVPYRKAHYGRQPALVLELPPTPEGPELIEGGTP